jgi:hypothetical protein
LLESLAAQWQESDHQRNDRWQENKKAQEKGGIGKIEHGKVTVLRGFGVFCC